MPDREEMESYAILLGGSVLILGLLLFAPSSAPRQFVLSGSFCDPQGVMAWLRRKLNQGKITAADIQRLLNTSVSFQSWLTSVFGQGGIDLMDVLELRDPCASASPALTSSSFPCPPFCP